MAQIGEVSVTLNIDDAVAALVKIRSMAAEQKLTYKDFYAVADNALQKFRVRQIANTPPLELSADTSAFEAGQAAPYSRPASPR